MLYLIRKENKPNWVFNTLSRKKVQKKKNNTYIKINF